MPQYTSSVPSPGTRRPLPPAPRRRTGRHGGLLRTVLFWCHLSVGATAGIVILVMSATGVALAYQKQLLAWSAGSHVVTPPSTNAARLPLDTLLARVRAAKPGGKVTSLTVNSDATRPVLVGLQNRSTLYVDPYTGRVQGSDAKARAVFTGIERWHRSLALGTGMRSPVGSALTGAGNLLFLFLLASGLVLWFPRKWSAQAFRAVLVPRLRAGGRVRDWNWHHVAGFWLAPFLALVVGSAVFMSYGWPQQAVNRLAGGGAQREGRGPGEGAPRGEGGEPRPGSAPGGQGSGWEVAVANLDGLWASAARQSPGWKTIQARLPQRPGGPVSFTVSRSSAIRPDLRTTLELDPTSGRTVKVQRYADQNAGQRVRGWTRFIHTGEVAGVLGQTLAALASAAGVVLVWTGFALALRRLRSWRSRRRKPLRA
ncbi:MAG: PepSY domain-containing protein [Gemmatimonadetes bacterium]|nr:PepSY domain-containing protein [Gemmatimonadota bacterium]